MSVTAAGFNSSAIFERIKAAMDGMPAAEKQATIKKVNGVFHMVVKNASGAEQTWTLDLKDTGNVSLGAEGKPTITISLSDDVFGELASGKLNGQKAFMSGKLKVKGNMMLATKLDTVLKAAQNAKPAAAPAAAAPKAAAAAPAGGVDAPGFVSSAVFSQIKSGIAGLPAAERSGIVGKVKSIFQFDVKNSEGKVQTWTIDLKNGGGDIILGAGAAKPDVTIAIADQDYVDLSTGKLNGQKAFMSGKLKVKGNVMLATKLDGVFKSLQQSKAKL
ncbi:hypothetical protein HK101_005692 [Irineochytrium annulatum]|nr:hypothetical protein HK101_005692 [Irineochytrium annulatum]